MARYKLTLQAKAEIAAIYKYTVKHWGSDQAKRYTSGLRLKMRQLANSPNMGKTNPDLEKIFYYSPYVSHVIYYTLTDYGISISAVLHKSMLPHLHLREP